MFAEKDGGPHLPTVISSCCILHNLCRLQGEEFPEDLMAGAEEPEHVEPYIVAPHERTIEAKNVRQALTACFNEQRAEN